MALSPVSVKLPDMTSDPDLHNPPVGGGAAKVLYTLRTARRMGLKNTAKALTSHNTCKACGLGMGGQRGGMTNELGEFPAVCNKSIQAQSTDIQPPIPAAFFAHSIADIRQLSARELEHAGRLGNPVFKAADSGHYREVSWDWALDYAAEQFRQTDPARSFFYSSGRSSNEAGFLLQLLARVYGTNNVNNCSYYCHQATSAGLGSTIGTGTATVELADLGGCDLLFLIGANPASNHPRFIHQLKSLRERGGDVIVINPAKEPGLVKFAVPKSARSLLTGGTEIASEYLQPHIGGDIALFKGIAKALLEAGAEDRGFLDRHCDNVEEFITDIRNTDWSAISAQCGIDRASITRIANRYASSSHTVFAWGMGITHHQFGVENVEYIASLALLRGMVGKRHAGLLPLRGHSNVQGIGTIGVKPVLPAEIFARMESTLGIQLPNQPGLDTFACLQQADAGQIDCACLVGGNLYAASPDSAWAAAALDRVRFKLYLTTTLNRGHLHGIDNSEALILPVVARDEEAQPTTQESMFNYVRLSDGGIERLANARSEVSILSALASRLCPDAGVDFQRFAQHRSIREAIAEIIPGMEPLADIDVARQEFHIRGRLLHEPVFHTANRRARLPVHPLPQTNPCAGEYPFLLASVRSEGQFNTMIYEETDSYRYTAPRNALLMSPEDMQRLALRAGDQVRVQSRSGVMTGMQVQAFDLPPGNLLAYFPEANILTEQRLDPRSLTPNFKSIPVRVEPE